MKQWYLIIVLSVLIVILITFKNPIKKMVSSAYKNNNPGNIRLTYDKNGKKLLWTGEIDGANKSFKTFRTIEDGFASMFRLLKEYNKKGFKTIRQIISRYAPPIENATESYINFISKKTGFNPDIEINLSDPIAFKKLVSSMSIQETGIKPDDKIINNAFKIV